MTTTIKKQILINARALLVSPENWVKGYSQNESNSAWCLMGTIDESVRRLGLDLMDPAGCAPASDAIFTLGNAVRRRVGGNSLTSIPEYNDADETTFNDVQELLDDAIDLCDA